MCDMSMTFLCLNTCRFLVLLFLGLRPSLVLLRQFVPFLLILHNRVGRNVWSHGLTGNGYNIRDVEEMSTVTASIILFAGFRFACLLK